MTDQSNSRVGGGASHMPGAVRAAIEAHERSSERIISYVQLVLVLGVSLLYASVPKPDQQLVAFMPVYSILGFYLAATLARIWLTHRGKLPDWVLFVSSVTDVAMLLWLIWCYHYQYGQNAAFSLKAPTFIYLFLFIGLRSLRLDYRFVLVSGAAACVGWLVLTGAAVWESGPDAVTRSFVTYTMGNYILVGLEIEKTIGLAVVTGVLALAVHRGRALLIQAMTEEASRRQLSRFFDPDVAQGIAAHEIPLKPGQGVRRDAAILTVDIRGFSRLAAQVPTEDLLRFLGDYQERIVKIVRRHGGAIDKFMGDGILCTFGAVRPSRTYAADAMRAIDAILADVERWNTARDRTILQASEVNCGLAVGSVIFGCVGTKTFLEHTVIGHAVNVSAKLEKHNKTFESQALVTADAFRVAVSQGYDASAADAPYDDKAPHAIDIGAGTSLAVVARSQATPRAS